MVLHLDRDEGCYSYVLRIDRVTFNVKEDSAVIVTGDDEEDIDIKGDDTILWTFGTLVEQIVKKEDKERRLRAFYDATFELYM